MRMTRWAGPLALGCALSALAATAQAQGAPVDYPGRPVKMIVAFTGGLVDTFTRALAQYLTGTLGQPVVVDNRPGASQAIGAEVAARSAPDGYTLFVGTQSGLVLNTVARKSLPYDPLRDFAPISNLFTTPFYLVANPSVAATTVQELVALARAQPGKLSFASIGRGSGHHLAAEMLLSWAKINVLHVPFQGSDRSSIALIAGQVDFMFEGPVSTLPHIRAGKLRALASTSDKRTDLLPGVPTMSEIVPGFVITPWIGLVAPTGVPRPIIDRLNREVVAMLRSPATRERFLPIGIELTPSTPEELGARLRADMPEWAKIMRDAGIQPE